MHPLGTDPLAHTHTYCISVHMLRHAIRWEEVLNLQVYLPFLPALTLGFRYQSCPVLPGLCNFQINKSLVAPAGGLIGGCGCFCLSVGVYHHSHHIHIKPHQQQPGYVDWQRWLWGIRSGSLEPPHNAQFSSLTFSLSDPLSSLVNHSG